MTSRTKRGNETRKATGRLSLRMRDEAFVASVHAYAERHETTVTLLVVDFFNQLLAAEGKGNSVEAEQA